MMIPMVYGFAVHSLCVVYDRLFPFFHGRKYRICVVSQLDPKALEVYAKSDMLFFNSVTEFVSVYPVIKGTKAACFVFDSPLQLKGLSEIYPCDYDNSKLDYMFRFRPVNYSRLHSRVIRSHESGKLHVSISEFKVIPKVIDRVKNGTFLDKFNSFIYSVTNHKTRGTYQKLIISYLLGNISLQQLQSTKKFRSRKASSLYSEVIRYLGSRFGNNLKSAMMAAAASTGPAVPYAKLCKKYGVDKYELKYLVLLWRKQGAFSDKVGDMKTLAKK